MTFVEFSTGSSLAVCSSTPICSSVIPYSVSAPIPYEGIKMRSWPLYSLRSFQLNVKYLQQLSPDVNPSAVLISADFSVG